MFLHSSSGEKLKVLIKFGMLHAIPRRQIIRLLGENLISETRKITISKVNTYGNARLKFPIYEEMV